MAKQSVRAEVNNFIGGLITEASPLNFPANASLDEENFELNRDGTRDRRLGMGPEPDSALIPTGLTSEAAVTAKFETFKWTNVNGIAGDEFLVVQVEKLLDFFDMSADSLSGDGFVGAIELVPFPSGTVFSFTSLEGKLIVAAGAETIAIVTYTPGVGFAASYEVLKVRDLWGVQVVGVPSYETDPTYRGVFEPSQHYNLQNQSWGIPRRNETGTLVDPVQEYANRMGVYPSNSEVVWTGMQFQPVTSGVTFERLFPNLFEESLGADVRAPKGYYIIDFLRRGQSRVAEFAANNVKHPTLLWPTVVLPTDLSPGGAKIVTEFAGRVFYGGFSGEVIGSDSRSPNISNYILFSQLVRSKADFTKCYQDGDPTSRENADLVDTDGGFIRISGAKTIIEMVDLESHLVVIADNGVWTITGGNDFGFSATNYKVSKISSFGGLSARSVVVEGGRAFFWSADGIYAIGKDNFGSFVVKSMTETTIQTFYEAIPATVRGDANGVYDPINKTIRWLFRDGTTFSGDSVTKELVFDTVLNAFYQSRIGKLSPNIVEVMSLFSSTPFKRGEIVTPVYVGADLVFSDVTDVALTETIRTSGLQSTRYLAVMLVAGAAFFTFCYYNNPRFLDWESVDDVGVDAKAFLLSGAQTAKDSAIPKQIPYLTTYMVRTESGVTDDLVPDHQSGCLMRSQWDFANTINSNKWTPLAQVYRQRRAQYVVDIDDIYDTGFELVVSKSKVRGRGKAFSLYLESEPLKDCRLVGWSISLNANTIA